MKERKVKLRRFREEGLFPFFVPVEEGSVFFEPDKDSFFGPVTHIFVKKEHWYVGKEGGIFSLKGEKIKKIGREEYVEGKSKKGEVVKFLLSFPLY